LKEIKIGKNAIENLTRGMYEDSRIIYREYIQNAADQIDYAVKHALFNEELYIDINIDEKNRDIKIKDNATGVKRDMIESTLAYVADSEKIKGVDKGFRGIGRLGGLAYCEKLRFITTAKGENKKTIMEWDAKELNRMLDDVNIKDSAGSILQKIITYSYEDCPEDDHYFIVELHNINKENVDLLDVEKVKDYIALNAPVPYDSKFYYMDIIYNYINQKGYPKNEYKIYVNGEDILKLYTTALYEKDSNGQKRKYDDIYDIKIEEFYNDKRELLAWMWYGISRFEKQIPFPLNQTAGIRLRQSNIQIGDERTLASLFKENRGNFYFIGEVHAVHKELTPNARRDYFNENQIRNEFETQLKYYFQSYLHQLYNIANRVKNAYKKEIFLYNKKEEYIKKKNHFINDKERIKFEQEIESAKAEKEKAEKEIKRFKVKAENDDVLNTVLKNIEKNHKKSLESAGFTNDNEKALTTFILEEQTLKKKSSYLVDELSNIPSKIRKFISRIYEIISRNLPPEQSEELIYKIQEELKNGKKNTTY